MDRTGPESHVEAVLSDALHAHAALAPPAATLLEAVAAKEIRRRAARRRTALVGAAGVAVAATVSGVVLAGVGAGGGARPVAARSDSGQARAYNFHGLEVSVPQSWSVNALRCGVPSADTVVMDRLGTETGCAVLKARVVQSVTFVNYPARGGTRTPAPGRAVAVDGLAGRLVSGRLPNGLTDETLIVPALEVSVEVQTRTPGLAGQIIASARHAAVDTNGCGSRVAALRPSGPPQRDGAQARLVPGRPTSVTLCRYTGGRLGHSTRFTAQQLTALLPLVNGLHPGLKRSTSVPAQWCTTQGLDGYLLRFGYASGPPLEVFVRLNGCDRLGADNGARTGGLTAVFGQDFVRRFDAVYGSVVAGDLH